MTPPDRHETALARSPFSAVTAWKVKQTRHMTVDEIVGLQLSTSYASPSVLNEHTDDFARVLESAWSFADSWWGGS